MLFRSVARHEPDGAPGLLECYWLVLSHGTLLGVLACPHTQPRRAAARPLQRLDGLLQGDHLRAQLGAFGQLRIQVFAQLVAFSLCRLRPLAQLVALFLDGRHLLPQRSVGLFQRLHALA